jgi:hypothetical protein
MEYVERSLSLAESVRDKHSIAGLSAALSIHLGLEAGVLRTPRMKIRPMIVAKHDDG